MRKKTKPPVFVTSKELAKRWNITPDALAMMRHRKKDLIPYYKLGASVRYLEKDILAHEAANLHSPEARAAREHLILQRG